MDETKKVLIIDDNAVARDSLESAFKKAEFDVVSAGDGEEGLKLALETKPDVILLDLIMPKMGGLELLSKIKQDNWGKTVRVVILTNREDNETIAKAVQEGGYEYLLKSQWTDDGIVEYIKKKLGAK